MPSTYIDEYLVIYTQELLKRKLNRSYVRTALGFGSLILVALLVFQAFEQRQAGFSILPVVVAIFAFMILIGYTPRRANFFRLILRQGEYWPTTTIHDDATKRARIAAARKAILTNADLGPDISRMNRRLKVLLIARLLAAVVILMIWVAVRWFDDHSKRTAHFERYGTYQAVNVYVALDGTETVTIDPDSPPGSVFGQAEQPPTRPEPRPAPTPVIAAPVDIPTPVNEGPIIAPNAPLPSYWPEVIYGYTQTIYATTPSGARTVTEIRVQYADGTMYAVGP